MKDQIVKAVKGEKKRTLRVTVFPEEGGKPYFNDVEPDDDGVFEYADGKSCKVVRGTVWEEDGRLRAICNEGNPLTVDPWRLSGDSYLGPGLLNGVASNNLWVQLSEIARRKSPWRQASTWGMLALGVVLVLTMVWMVTTVGGGLEELRDALDGIRVAGGGGSGHQPIAPRR